MWTLGIESTAHTLSFGLVDKNGIPYPASTSTIKPEKGGIHPREAADHHKESAARLLQSALSSQSITTSDISAIAYSQGPGLGPCLRIGASIARGLSAKFDVPLIGVALCISAKIVTFVLWPT